MESALQEILADRDIDDEPDEIVARIPGMIPDLASSIALSMLANIKKDAPSMLKTNRLDQRRFENKLRKRWKKPLDLLTLFISLSTEAGVEFNSEFRNDAVRSGDAVFEALTRLHAKACQTASAILTLLGSGYADDAHARWRSIHEIAVVSLFISENGQELAKRYLLHETVQQYRLACEHQKYHKRINDEPISEEEFNMLKSKHDGLVDRFGKEFQGSYGWAASVVRGPTIQKIEEHVKLDHMRPYYRMASDNEHPNSHGAHFRLGLNQWNRDVLLAGPSNLGLADPGHSTAISLNQVTTTLLATRSNLDCLVITRILHELTSEIGEEFLKAHQEAETIAMNTAKRR